MLLEMNQDNFDGRNRGDEPAKDLSSWMEKQKKLKENIYFIHTNKKFLHRLHPPNPGPLRRLSSTRFLCI